MSILEKVCNRTVECSIEDINTGKGMDIWQWGQGVALYGLGRAYEKTGDSKIKDFIKRWIDYHLDEMNFGYSINTTAPLLGIMKLLEEDGSNEKYEKICDSFAKWCITDEPRCDRGAFEHTCTENKYDNQIWADTLFMGCLFLIKWGLYTKTDIYIKEAIRQFKLHYQFLSDNETGLMYHGYDCNERAQKGVLWGRGNGWFAVAAPEVLSILPKDTPGYDGILEDWKKMLGAMVRFQREDGGWSTVINRHDTYLEMSVTAAFTYSMKKAVEFGIGGDEYVVAAEKSMKCLISNIDDDGNVLNGSLGTCVMEDYKKYNDILCGYTGFTQGLAMLALLHE